jgi:hypothetical protein
MFSFVLFRHLNLLHGILGKIKKCLKLTVNESSAKAPAKFIEIVNIFYILKIGK